MQTPKLPTQSLKPLNFRTPNLQQITNNELFIATQQVWTNSNNPTSLLIYIMVLGVIGYSAYANPPMRQVSRRFLQRRGLQQQPPQKHCVVLCCWNLPSQKKKRRKLPMGVMSNVDDGVFGMSYLEDPISATASQQHWNQYFKRRPQNSKLLHQLPNFLNSSPHHTRKSSTRALWIQSSTYVSGTATPRLTRSVYDR